jgi:eukaryotic-like serine/threonine-protein kinase
MDPADASRLPERELFDRACDLPEGARAAFLASACPDAALRRRVEALLEAHDRAGSAFLARPAATLTDAADGRAGRRLGPYEIVRELGRGGMGVVYLANRADDEYRKAVAIKVVAAPLGDEALVRRFRRERQILAQVEHPHIARLLDGGTTAEGLPFLVMEFVEGRRIDEYCTANRLDVPARLRLFRQVCEAVQQAHASLVIHRDLKPQNILVTADGTPKLLDFGIARLLEDEGTQAGETTLAGAAALTPEYASPEQLRAERLTTASDVYSLGVLLYELLAGARPYEVGSRRPDEVLRAIAGREPARPSVVAAQAGDHQRARQLRGDLDTIVLAAMHADPARRYGSAASLAEDIARHLDGLPVSARGDSAAYRIGRFVRRHRVAAAAAAAVMIKLMGGMVATAWQARIADRQRQEAERQRARAERRFDDVRRLANSVLFELHDAIAPLAGSTPARQLVVTRGLEYLDSLAAESAGDRALQQELAAAYDRVGDVQGSQMMANLGDAEGALRSYGKAEAIRRALAEEDPGSIASRAGLAASDMKIGDALIGRGAVPDAVARYRAAIAVRRDALEREWPSASEARFGLAEASGRLCTTLPAVGDVPGALEHCRLNRELTDVLLAETPDAAGLRLMRASNTTALGNLLRMTRQTDEAIVALEEGVRRYRELLEANGGQEIRRRLAVAYGYLASAQLDLQAPAAAVETFRLAAAEIEGLAAVDPSNVRPRIELAYMVNRRAQVLVGLNRAPEARREASRAIALLAEAASRPGAGGEIQNEYAWTLVSTEPAELRDPRLALQFIDRAIAGAGSPNAVFLHTRAWALHRLGRTGEALATLAQALELLPSEGPSVGLRRQIEASQAAFEPLRARH